MTRVVELIAFSIALSLVRGNNEPYELQEPEGKYPGPNYDTAAGAKKKFQNLIFEDNFDKELDLNKWSHEHTLRGGGNWEFQYYTDDKRISYVKDGNLVIKPMFNRDFLNVTEKKFQKGARIDIPKVKCTDPLDWGCSRVSGRHGLINPIVSAKLITKTTFKYGRVEVRAKLPRGDWLWPAIWMMPKDSTYGDWPKSGEIDITESKGNGPEYHSDGVDTVSSTLHWGTQHCNSQFDRTLKKFRLPEGQDYSKDFHIYNLEWTEDYIRTYVDDQQLMDMDFTKVKSMYEFGQLEGSGPNPWEGRGANAPFDQEFKLMINLAVGGVSFFPDSDEDGTKDTKKPWENGSAQAPREFWQRKDYWYPTWVNGGEMLVDSVKIYQ